MKECEGFTCPKCSGHRLIRTIDVIEHAPLVKLSIGADGYLLEEFSPNREEYEYFEAEDVPNYEYHCVGCGEIYYWDELEDLLKEQN